MVTRKAWHAPILLMLVALPVQAEWKVDSDSDPFTDEEAVFAYTRADGGYQDTGRGNVDAWLYVRCWEGKRLETFIVMDAYLGKRDRIDIRYRYDDELPHRIQWEPASNGNSAFANNGRHMAERLAAHDRFRLEVVSPTDRRYVLDFDLGGSAEAIEPIIDQCPESS